jgi:glyoxylase-like metal-dependent hydrolase (beta-lactamase superfamily II)
MKEQTSADFVQTFWEPRFPGQLPKHLVVAEELGKNVIELDGESLIVVLLAFTDTAGTTCLQVPSLELIAAGDGAYNGVHPRLVESNQNQKRGEWLSALDKMAALHPRNVVAGHKNVKNDDDGVRVISETRQYILDFEEVAGKTTTAKELYDGMLVRYPEWLNRGALWSSATAAKK